MNTETHVEELLSLWHHRLALGQDLSAEELCRDFPDVLPEVQRRLAALRRVHEIHGQIDSEETVDAETLSQPDEDAGQVQWIGRYRVKKKLGKGGFGVVYLALDEQLQRFVAVKVPHRELVAGPEDAAAYLTEARTVAGLDHPNIVPVYDVGSSKEFPCFIVSKYVAGNSLAHQIRYRRPSPTGAAELVATVAEALHYAHRNGLVHRDVKPGNIMLDADGRPFVVDFGLALKDENLGRGPKYAGTPAYMSPEQARGEGHRVDGRSDIFSLGVVFYELLTGRRPFAAETRSELLEQIRMVEARPPRQIDDSIPKELERVCLKALSKRASDRYTTATDLADDLRHYLAEQIDSQPSGPLGKAPRSASPTDVVQPGAALTGAGVWSAPAPGSGTSSEALPVKIVPKGLRSFDAHDADFFLELLPGPRDREGLPDSIRFWKTRIEEADPDNTFAVGLLYGPSGCGKSSLVKAGLLPRLSNQVVTVYVEATAGETEARLLHGLRKQCPALLAKLGLKETLAALRRGQGIPVGKRVLIVLDQFEQWLHAKNEEENTELVQALRQCDGSRVQCLVMVRDDFWMAAVRFMRELEIRQVEGQNFAAVDLFSLRHAEKVLAAFGRAFGALPETSGEVGKDHRQFLEQTVHGLAQEGKVICVRLALFAEMMKGKSWTPATLKEVGGAQGLGATFLEGTFAASTAPPEHRYHQKAARAVLKALLPESGTDIKGHMRSHAELLAASGYANRPREFDGLLRILDGELRLITPTDPHGKEEDAPYPVDPTGVQYYQLTHDYLVPSLRDWLTRKQKETRRGRAELLLADRAAVWNARPENRQLPSLLQWCRLQWLTRQKDWTLPQQQMMRRATRYHVIRGLLAAAILLLLGRAGWEGDGRLQAHHLVDRLLEANTAEVPRVIEDMTAYRRWVDPLLREEYAQAERDNDRRKQLHASLALLSSDPGQAPYLYERLLAAEPQELGVIRKELVSHKSEFVQPLWSELADGKNPARRFRAACALAEYAPSDPQWADYGPFLVQSLVGENALLLTYWKELLEPVRNHLLGALALAVEDSRTEAAHRRTITDLYRGFNEGQQGDFSPLEERLAAGEEGGGQGVDRVEAAKRRANVAASLVAIGRTEKVWPLLIHSNDPTARSYLIERLGSAGLDPRILQSRLKNESNVTARRALVLALGGFPADQLQSLESALIELYENDSDPGMHAASGWVLRRCGRGEPLGPIDRRLATGQVEGHRGWYVNKQGQTFTLIGKPHLPEAGAGNESAGFAIASTEVTVAQFREFRPGHKVNEEVAPTPDCPVNLVSWYDAVAYCNWLSEKEGIPRNHWCYVSKDGKLDVAPGYLKLAGYRLPTEAEWEYACRAGAETKWCCGEADEELVGRYARWYGNAQSNGVNRSFPVATLKPNDFGLFDMHGNVSEWCQDVTAKHANALRRDEEAGLSRAEGEVLAVARGGNFTCPFRKVSCDSWGGLFRSLPLGFAGLRPVRSSQQIIVTSPNEKTQQ